ncbi:MAG: HTTM domain-containing protein [Armatimonadetes bacterium]|nr:HTTM domain-containing protein [Armatimonadota bacterium]
MSWFKRIDQYLFGFGSPVTLGVYRALMGSLIFINLAMIAKDFSVWFTDAGPAPANTAAIWAGDQWNLNVLRDVTDPRIAMAVYGVTMLAALMVALGLTTRLATIVLYIGFISLHHRNPFILHGGDTLMRCSVITLMLAPCGAAFSLDRLISQRAGKPTKDLVSLWPQRLIQFEMCLMYLTTVWHKWGGRTWRDGTAAWYPPHLSEFFRFPMPNWIDLPPYVQISSYGTLVIEILLGTLVFYKPARKWVLISGIFLHFMIEWRFNIPLFAFICWAQYVSHYSGEEVQGWLDRAKLRFLPQMNKEAASG